MGRGAFCAFAVKTKFIHYRDVGSQVIWNIPLCSQGSRDADPRRNHPDRKLISNSSKHLLYVPASGEKLWLNAAVYPHRQSLYPGFVAVIGINTGLLHTRQPVIVHMLLKPRTAQRREHNRR